MVKNNKKTHVVIAGAGVAGLSAAWKLCEEGYPVTVLERESEVGGLSKTVSYKGFLFDYSAHRFNSDNPEIVSRFKKIVGKRLIRRQKKALIYHWGKYVIYPPLALEIVRTMPPWLVVRSGMEFLAVALKSFFVAPKGKSFSDWTRARFGKTLSMHLNEKYAEKLWKMPVHKLSGDWASTRVGGFKLKDFLLGLFSKLGYQRAYSQSHPDSDWFYYSDEGIGHFPKGLVREIKKLGGDVRVSSPVVGVQKKAKGYTVSFLNKSSIRTIAADIVISTMPLDHLSNILKPSVPSDVKKAVSSLGYLAVIMVNVLIKKKEINDASWIYYPDGDLIFNYIMEFRNWSKKMASPGKTSLCVNITCRVGDETWKMKDADLTKRVISDLEKVRMVKKDDVYDGFVVRLPYAYPVYDIHYKRKLKKIQEYISALPDFYVTGRTGNFKYINSDKAMEDGIDLAEKIIRTQKR
ncbi:hypothetical protein A3H80_04005 [Candidatus Roizmanbacteria bacterium RIFCSPLOWO2_02_FULL_37_19]|uniref:Amine oxidase domain-containing protein n=1 Tax=Candidatus Roizmanbacteria bacterium RIFCSPHIGHO2_02_FULL_37_24 TaxID=1802037 RepID=A0A1F7GWP4_9BACT|nr:MAG: hypothetical protein A2862_04440 [Candidatus Roizmanbacteria bacterium RIFCSPHIGHO2_01_FULL_38_41]OGK23184.1 MAG: hypothetical protein A3C24_00815 [Candidatus Roizmanbacteria bacterium RIFCSPHIGHO2_02_FULL_37_24]OGK33828.1 MAG: hypothetical protein A3E10_05415 [Candidatus Roizmanbacteria bacterium RIFCSPHIGHO2_12_FULL_37_23]OGK43889.1 MAG: hypothetical protein A2956_01800 [Candidatus Roizmanbacteria bacterium RIFCSPLOWO2_01_FULL_37_57]OGK53672.1 MAG: hypothetical protein A3H80_04005 [Ca